MLVALLLLAIRLLRRHDSFDKAATVVNALATGTAACLRAVGTSTSARPPTGGYLAEGGGLKVSPDYVTLQVWFEVKNLGATLLELGKTDAG